MKRKRTKPIKAVKRQLRLLIKLGSWGNYTDEAYQLESLLAKKPKQLQIEFVGPGEIPADTALLMRSMIQKRSPQTRIVTNARSSLIGAAVLLWLLGDTRQIREDAQLRLRPAGPFVPDDAPVAWKDRCTCDECEIAEQDYRCGSMVITPREPCVICAKQPWQLNPVRFPRLNQASKSQALTLTSTLASNCFARIDDVQFLLRVIIFADGHRRVRTLQRCSVSKKNFGIHWPIE